MKLVIKPERKVKDEERTIMLSKFQKWLVPENKDLQTEYGIITKEELKKSSFTKYKETFHVLKTNFLDDYKQIRRDRQIVTLKDIGAIITLTGINKNTKVLDAGTGSGAVACYLASICKEVTSIDNKKENTELAIENAKKLNLTNITFKTEDIAKAKLKDFDVFFLDIPEVTKAFKTAETALKSNGFLLCYTPQIEQAISAVRKIPKSFMLESVSEMKQQLWQIDEKRSKPSSSEIPHTAFLTLFRKL